MELNLARLISEINGLTEAAVDSVVGERWSDLRESQRNLANRAKAAGEGAPLGGRRR